MPGLNTERLGFQKRSCECHANSVKQSLLNWSANKKSAFTEALFNEGYVIRANLTHVHSLSYFPKQFPFSVKDRADRKSA